MYTDAWVHSRNQAIKCSLFQTETYEMKMRKQQLWLAGLNDAPTVIGWFLTWYQPVGSDINIDAGMKTGYHPEEYTLLQTKPCQRGGENKTIFQNIQKSWHIFYSMIYNASGCAWVKKSVY